MCVFVSVFSFIVNVNLFSRFNTCAFSAVFFFNVIFCHTTTILLNDSLLCFVIHNLAIIILDKGFFFLKLNSFYFGSVSA